MKKVLVMTYDGEKLNNFIKEYFYGINYVTIYGENATIFDSTDTIIISVEPYTALVGHRYHEIYVDENLLFEKDYADSIEACLVQNKTSIIRGF